MKITAEFAITDLQKLKIKMLNWANRFSIFCLLDNQQYDFEKPAFECLLGVGIKRAVTTDAGTAFESLKSFYGKGGSYLFGHFGYDLKNETEQLTSGHVDSIGFPDLFFFEPEIVLQLSTNSLVIYAESSPEEIFEAIQSTSGQIGQPATGKVVVQSRFNKQEYIETVEQLKAHILRGDCYEVNFCQEFFASDVSMDAVAVYMALSKTSPNPFSALYKLHDKFCICASPERYLKKNGHTIISQPIKGTSARNTENNAEDHINLQRLMHSEKEKSENTMVVDLVRNDLSRVCRKGSVKVTALHKVFSFPQVHQMISTITGEVSHDVHWVDIVKATFPMGSMTGAPKKRVMELIEKYERTKRGLFSGAIGYITPSGDFDFNVVIRSLLYNQDAAYLSYQAGSAITFKSNAAEEYAECLLKVQAINTIFTQNKKQL